MPVAAGEPLDERVGVVATRQRQRGELQAGRPALGALGQRARRGSASRSTWGKRSKNSPASSGRTAGRTRAARPARRPAGTCAAGAAGPTGCRSPACRLVAGMTSTSRASRSAVGLRSITCRSSSTRWRPARPPGARRPGPSPGRRRGRRGRPPNVASSTPGDELLERDQDRVEEVLGVGVARRRATATPPGRRWCAAQSPHRDGLARSRRTGDDDEARPRAPQGGDQALAADRREAAGATTSAPRSSMATAVSSIRAPCPPPTGEVCPTLRRRHTA